MNPNKTDFAEAAKLIANAISVGGVLCATWNTQEYVLFNSGKGAFEIGDITFTSPEEAEILAMLLNAWAEGNRK